jgi:hypothetical protein
MSDQTQETLAVAGEEAPHTESSSNRPTGRSGTILFIAGATKLSGLNSAQTAALMGTAVATSTSVRGAASRAAQQDSSAAIESAVDREDAFAIGAPTPAAASPQPDIVVACSVFSSADAAESATAAGGVAHSNNPETTQWIARAWVALAIAAAVGGMLYCIHHQRSRALAHVVVCCALLGFVFLRARACDLPRSVPSGGSAEAPGPAALPPSFDCRARWPAVSKPPTDQGDCGRCWAVVSADVAADRARIAGAPEDVWARLDWRRVARAAGVADDASACKGEMLGVAARAAASLVPRARLQQPPEVRDWYARLAARCHNSTVVDAMRDSCVAAAPFMDPGSAATLLPLNVERMKRAIMEGGPLLCGMVCSASLRSLVAGVWYPTGHSSDAVEGGHAVKIIGWTRVDVLGEVDVEAWIVQNSWGDRFGSAFLLRHQDPIFSGSSPMRLCKECQLEYADGTAPHGGCFLLRISDESDVRSPACSMIEFEAFDIRTTPT